MFGDFVGRRGEGNSAKEIGGLGSSHTTPCGAAVPARPPTRSLETTDADCVSQWAARANLQSTRVLVLCGFAAQSGLGM